MFDLIYDFIKNSLFNTNVDVFGLDLILTFISIILIFVFFVKLLIWVFNFVARW